MLFEYKKWKLSSSKNEILEEIPGFPERLRWLKLRGFSIYILAIDSKCTNSNDHSKVRVINNISLGLGVPLINNANCSLVFIRFLIVQKEVRMAAQSQLL